MEVVLTLCMALGIYVVLPLIIAILVCGSCYVWIKYKTRVRMKREPASFKLQQIP